jgi:peptidoglycan hydrolase-like protein with peptidoglycan-binding domain
MPPSGAVSTIGLDYASVDDNHPPDFNKARQAGARFAIPRAIYGRRARGQTDSAAVFVDPAWARDKDAIAAAGLQRTAYLFVCYPRTGVVTPSPEDQAQAFIDHVQLERGKDFVPMFDVEEASDTLSPSEMYDWTVRVCTKLREHYGAWPGMYTSARVWSDNLKGHAAGALSECPLWLAKPWPWAANSEVHLDGAPDHFPITIPQFGDETNYWIYQYQGDALHWPGFTRSVDANRFHNVASGDRGTIVAWIQRRVDAAADGDFGPATEAAVKAFQSKHGLVDDGVVGPATFAQLCWVM